MSFHLFKKPVWWISSAILLILALSIGIIIRQNKNFPKRQQNAAQKAWLSKTFQKLDSMHWKNPENNLMLTRQAIKIARKIGDSNAFALAVFNKGRLYQDAEKHDSSLLFLEQALKMANALHDNTLILRIENAIAVYYLNKDDYYKSMTYFTDALKKSEQSGKSIYTGMVLNGLGLVYYSLNDYDNSIKNLEQSCKIAREFREPRIEAAAYINIGCCYMAKKDYSRAMYYNQKALNAFEKLNDSTSINKVIIDIGLIYKVTGKTPLAFSYFERAIQYARRINNDVLLGIALQDQGSLYAQQRNVPLAKKYLHQSLKISSMIGPKSNEMNVLLALSEIAEKEKQWELSHRYYKGYTEIKDSIINGDIQNKIVELKWKYDFQKKEFENKLLQKKYDLEKRQKFFLVVILIFFLVIVLMIGIVINLAHKNLRKSYKLKDIENKHLEEKIKTDEKINMLEKLHYQTEIESKNNELTSASLQLIAKNEFMRKISELVENNSPNASDAPIYVGLKKMLKQNFNQEADWKQFKELFENVHKEFFIKLKQICPGLSENELRLCAYLRVNLQNKEIAKMLNIYPETVITSRYRIRKKLGLDTKANLEDFIRSL